MPNLSESFGSTCPPITVGSQVDGPPSSSADLKTQFCHSIELHDRANGLARSQVGKALVDGGKPDAPGDQLIQHQAAVEIGLRQYGKVARRPRAAIARAADALFLHQRAPAERHGLLHADLAEPDNLAAGANV